LKDVHALARDHRDSSTDSTAASTSKESTRHLSSPGACTFLSLGFFSFLFSFPWFLFFSFSFLVFAFFPQGSFLVLAVSEALVNLLGRRLNVAVKRWKKAIVFMFRSFEQTMLSAIPLLCLRNRIQAMKTDVITY
jgi:hypothetical protein